MASAPEVVHSVPGSSEAAASRAEERESERRAAKAVSKVSWVPQGELTEEEWLATGRRLGIIGRGSKWWLGDWVRHGSARWGDRFTEAERVSGYDRGTLRTMAWIAGKVDASCRRDALTWDHHVAVASLAPEEQRSWLERAEAESWTPDELKQKLRSGEQGEAGGSTAQSTNGAQRPAGTVCPHCGHREAAG